MADDEAALTADSIEPACRACRYGYRRIMALLRGASWSVYKKRVAEIWRQEGLKVLQREPKRGPLWLNGCPCIRLRPERLNLVVDASGRGASSMATRKAFRARLSSYPNLLASIRSEVSSLDI